MPLCFSGYENQTPAAARDSVRNSDFFVTAVPLQCMVSLFSICHIGDIFDILDILLHPAK